jgi:hypothetical protein
MRKASLKELCSIWIEPKNASTTTFHVERRIVNYICKTMA